MNGNKLITKFLKAIKENEDNTEIKNFKIDNSNIHGKGVIATKKIKPGDFINIALFKGHDDDFHTTAFGAHLNHSYEPNARTRFEGDYYRTYSTSEINPGDEITVDYTKNKALEQPEKEW
jgi:SET domain-containing protein